MKRVRMGSLCKEEESTIMLDDYEETDIGMISFIMGLSLPIVVTGSTLKLRNEIVHYINNRNPFLTSIEVDSNNIPRETSSYRLDGSVGDRILICDEELLDNLELLWSNVVHINLHNDSTVGRIRFDVTFRGELTKNEPVIVTLDDNYNSHLIRGHKGNNTLYIEIEGVPQDSIDVIWFSNHNESELSMIGNIIDGREAQYRFSSISSSDASRLTPVVFVLDLDRFSDSEQLNTSLEKLSKASSGSKVFYVGLTSTVSGDVNGAPESQMWFLFPESTVM